MVCAIQEGIAVCAIQEGIASVAESSTDRDVPCVEGKQAANSDRRNM